MPRTRRVTRTKCLTRRYQNSKLFGKCGFFIPAVRVDFSGAAYYAVSMKKFFKEFKAFISRGNIVDLSVAVIIGARL